MKPRSSTETLRRLRDARAFNQRNALTSSSRVLAKREREAREAALLLEAQRAAAESSRLEVGARSSAEGVSAAELAEAQEWERSERRALALRKAEADYLEAEAARAREAHRAAQIAVEAALEQARCVARQIMEQTNNLRRASEKSEEEAAEDQRRAREARRGRRS